MNKLSVPKPLSAGLILSYSCNSECKHCMYFCSPKWEKKWIEKIDLEVILEKISKYVVASPFGPNNVSLNYGLHITGGEPFLNYPILFYSIKVANEFQIPSLFAETNCFWCKNDEVTREKLMELKNTGLKGILISVNPFILEYVPFEHTERATRISREIFGDNAMIYQMYNYNQFRSLKLAGKLSLGEYLKYIDINDLQEKVELFKMGRAVYKLQNLYHNYPIHTYYNSNCQYELVRSWHNHFDNYGNYMPGYCGGLSWGHINDLESMFTTGLDLEYYPILKKLITGTMEELYLFAKENYGYHKLDNGYISKCHLCIDIRKEIMKSTNQVRELQPREFYAYI